ncbi:MAG: efflux RND transporter permease subunit [Phycisphaerales bacterium]|nr:MAG: efflux RND transporter permease subunit [Phycisphaerales bacterium]
MNLAQWAVDRAKVTWTAALLLSMAGVIAYFQMGKLEDPEFTIKAARVITLYPGATAEEVELEVTDRLERALQEMEQVDRLTSVSSPGMSNIEVRIQSQYWSDRLPQVWDELRRKVNDAQDDLPPGAQPTQVHDDYGDVFGFLLAVTSDGFDYADLKQYVDDVKKALALVDGVARVEKWGEQTRTVELTVSSSRLAELGLSVNDVQRTLDIQNQVLHTGGLEVGGQRLRVELTGEFTSLDDLGDLILIGRDSHRARNDRDTLRMRDVAEIRYGYRHPPRWIMRHDGKPAIGLAISNQPGVNVVDLGRDLDATLQRINTTLPIGIEIERVAWQADLVAEATRNFMLSLIVAVGIVLIVLGLAMGIRLAFIVGVGGLVTVILASFAIMHATGIDLHRVSLGALVIALGMMVDNAIVVSEGALVRMRQGQRKREAVIDAAQRPAWMLFGATALAIAAFLPIYFNVDDVGEFLQSLFQVVAIALLVSWLLSMTLVPVMCMALLKEPRNDSSQDLYTGRLFNAFRTAMRWAIKRRLAVSLTALILVVGAGVAFQLVPRTFFPDATRHQFMIDYWSLQGTRIETVSESLREIEAALLTESEITSVTSFIGQGPPRFYLPVTPELPYASYAHLIVNTTSVDAVEQLASDLQRQFDQRSTDEMIRVRRFVVGKGATWPFEARIVGPSEADLITMRQLGEQAREIVSTSHRARDVRTNWRELTPYAVLPFSQQRANWADVTRADVARAILRATDGTPVGIYREDEDLLPIVLRHKPMERDDLVNRLTSVPVRSLIMPFAVPLGAVTDDLQLAAENSLIWRRNRHRTITVQAGPNDATADDLWQEVAPQLEAMDLPSGYQLEFGGEYEDSRDARHGLIPGLPPAALIIVLVLIALFNGFRPALITLAILPVALIGIAAALLATGTHFTFLALLGVISLAGMMIKNSIVLIDQINLEKAESNGLHDALVNASTARLRPIVLAAGTTVLGVTPLLADVFWRSMAITIMSGLTVGAIATLVLLPVLYALFNRPAEANKA